MDRLDARARAREVLDQVYMTEPAGGERSPELGNLAELARAARAEGAPLGEHASGPWRSDRCRLAHTVGPRPATLTCVMRGEFELPLPEEYASEVAALLNWAEVPEPGAQT